MCDIWLIKHLDLIALLCEAKDNIYTLKCFVGLT